MNWVAWPEDGKLAKRFETYMEAEEYLYMVGPGWIYKIYGEVN